MLLLLLNSWIKKSKREIRVSHGKLDLRAEKATFEVKRKRREREKETAPLFCL